MPRDPDLRCSVIGNAGGGKSVLARAMASRLDAPLHELDGYLWEGNWRSVPEDDFASRHADLIAQDRWIVDGFGLPDTVYPRIARSTHVVYVELPIWLHFSLAAERQGAWKAGTLKNPPGGMRHPPPTKVLFELMWRIHTELEPPVGAAVDEAAGRGCRVERVRSLERLRALQFDPLQILG